MSTKSGNQTEVTPTAPPPYIPWKTFEGYLATLKKTTVPHSIDRTIKPPTMAGGFWTQLVSSLRFLRLINEAGETQPALDALVKAHGSTAWKDAVGKHIVSAYKPIIDGLSITNATPGQLDSRFKERGKVAGQMQEKSIRFFLHAVRESGQQYSPHLTMRRERSRSNPRTKAESPNPKETRNKTEKEVLTTDPIGDDVPKGYMRFPLQNDRWLIVPKDISKADVKTVSSYLAAFVGAD